jgi:hypothetical protein
MSETKKKAPAKPKKTTSKSVTPEPSELPPSHLPSEVVTVELGQQTPAEVAHPSPKASSEPAKVSSSEPSKVSLVEPSQDENMKAAIKTLYDILGTLNVGVLLSSPRDETDVVSNFVNKKKNETVVGILKRIVTLVQQLHDNYNHEQLKQLNVQNGTGVTNKFIEQLFNFYKVKQTVLPSTDMGEEYKFAFQRIKKHLKPKKSTSLSPKNNINT